MKKATYILLIIFLAGIAGIAVQKYAKHRKDKEAKAYYKEAEKLYNSSKTDSALIVLDLLPFKYPASADAKYLAEKLKLEINKKTVKDSIDSVSSSINDIRTELLKAGQFPQNISQTESLRTKIDSLTNVKNHLRQQYSAYLKEEEKYNCAQCVSIMRSMHKSQ